MGRLQQIEEIFQEALQHDPAEREAYVREACGGDTELQRQVSSLLANHHDEGSFETWAARAAAQLIDAPASLQPGQCLGPYRIECFLAAGGMGVVYRATDTRLHREVAIKVSAARFSERFEVEARVIASLNHPHICQLYDVGPNYLVMELVEGPTLADRIQNGALPLDEALAVARQIAEALEAAHEKGRVHRDLKPANVKITPEGVVKVLDFGLAKAAEEPSAVGDPSVSPTLTMSPTRAGMILGTAPYMSPEQARGAAVDKRADIWAFGVVLYEMLTGKQTFRGETTSDILAAVLKEEPDWSRIPASVQHLLRRCLVKDPRRRLRDIGDAMPLLDGVRELAPARRPWVWIGVAAVLAIALCVAAVGWWRATRPAPLHPLVQLSADLPPATTINRFRGVQMALSPDGTRIAVIELHQPGGYRLATRQLNQSEFAPLPGTEGANMPFFSPDSQWIGFFANGKLKKVAIQGGSPVTLCDAPMRIRGASWGDDDNIIASFNGGLSRVPASGGSPALVPEQSTEKDQIVHAWPQVLPGSQTVLFTSSVKSFDDANIDVLSFKTGQRKTVLRGGFFGRYLATSKWRGHLVYLRHDTLFSAPFDLGRLEVTGARQPILDDISNSNNSDLGGYANFDFSQTGTFVYANAKLGFPEVSIFWLDNSGNTQPLHSTPGLYRAPRFSPDGKRLAFWMVTRPVLSDIWVKGLERDTTSRLTSLPGENSYPVWTPDGKNIVFRSSPAARGMYWIRADGSGEPQRLTDDKTSQIPSSFSPDGKRLAYQQLNDDGNWEIWTAPVEGDGDRGAPGARLGKAERFLRTSGLAPPEPAFSPDGRWLAYQSDETGRYEVFVRPFLGPGSKAPISTEGGRFPIWSRNGRELFYLGPDQRIMVAGYTANGDSFAVGKPQVWSPKSLVIVLLGHPYDLAPDGKRFAVLLYPGGTAEQQQKPIDSVTVLLNFFDELKRRVPTGGK
jgi:Tol biopolymer transport system component/predicted Ser/Thr protein kinase